jgi:hypothetical protein
MVQPTNLRVIMTYCTLPLSGPKLYGSSSPIWSLLWEDDSLSREQAVVAYHFRKSTISQPRVAEKIISSRDLPN